MSRLGHAAVVSLASVAALVAGCAIEHKGPLFQFRWTQNDAGLPVGPEGAPPAAGPQRDPNDVDGDGIPNARDACPEWPEDLDGFEDLDGCPDMDNDGDGVLDPLDACPGEAGDGSDGCPPPRVPGCELNNAGVELCNGLDDDCDGEIDEGFHVGVGCTYHMTESCFVRGTYACDGPDHVACAAPPPESLIEYCNGKDDDCDGEIDENCVAP